MLDAGWERVRGRRLARICRVFTKMIQIPPPIFDHLRGRLWKGLVGGAEPLLRFGWGWPIGIGDDPARQDLSAWHEYGSGLR